MAVTHVIVMLLLPGHVMSHVRVPGHVWSWGLVVGHVMKKVVGQSWVVTLTENHDRPTNGRSSS